MPRNKTVKDSKTIAICKLKKSWDSNKESRDDVIVSRDSKRARILAEGVEAGLSQEEIAEALGITQQYINYLLRYHRFNQFVENGITTVVVIPISERTFRNYWRQLGNMTGIGAGNYPKDPERAAKVRLEREAVRNEYERKVFDKIVTWIQAGKAPMAPAKKPRPKPEVILRTKSEKAISVREYKRHLRQAYQDMYKEIETDLKELVEAVNKPHDMLKSTSWASMRARHIESVLKRLFTLIQEEKIEEVSA